MTKLHSRKETESTQSLVIYCRVSRAGERKDVQATLANAISLDAQLEAGRAYAAKNDMEVVAEIKEVESGRKVANRKEFQRALKLCKRHKATLHVWSLSRAFRSVRDSLETAELLSSWGCSLISKSEGLSFGSGATQKAVYSLLSTINQLEADYASERVVNSLNVKRTRGEWLGGHAPYGYAIDADGVKLVPVKSELKHLNYMIRLSNEGLSYREIARRLERRKVPTKQGNCRWWGSTVNKVLTRHAKMQELGLN